MGGGHQFRTGVVVELKPKEFERPFALVAFFNQDGSISKSQRDLIWEARLNNLGQYTQEEFDAEVARTSEWHARRARAKWRRDALEQAAAKVREALEVAA